MNSSCRVKSCNPIYDAVNIRAELQLTPLLYKVALQTIVDVAKIDQGRILCNKIIQTLTYADDVTIGGFYQV